VKKIILLCSTALVMPTAAFAQSTGTVTTEEEKEIVVTGTRTLQNVDGIAVPDTTKAKGLITQELIAKQSPGQTILNVVNLIPGVNFTNSDPYGSSGGNIRIRGFDGNRISLTFDGVPLNDSGNYAIFSNQQLDPELIEQVNVGLGVTDVDSPTASAAGGTINYRTLIPSKDMGVRLAGSFGSFDYRRFFGMFQTGEFTSFGTKAWISASSAINDKFKGPGEINKRQYNARIYQPLGNNGDFISIAGHYNKNRNNFYRNPSITDLRGILGAAEIPATPAQNPPGTFVPTADDPFKIGYTNDDQWDLVNDFENLASCNRTVAGPLRQDDNGGTGPNGTGANAPALPTVPYGSVQNNPLNSQSCTNYFGVRINPSNTGNIRGQSRFTLSDALILTVDPSFQYVLANGGGSTAFNEFDRQIRGNLAVAGVDLNGDGDILDRIRLFTPNNTNTKRYGLTSSLIWDVAPDHRVRVAYTYDRAHHRQTGEFGFLEANGQPENVFGGRNGTPVLDAAGNVLQQRDRTSIALLNQISGQYIGKFFDDDLRVEVGVRRPFFKRDLDQNCYTFASGSGFAYCSSEVLGTTVIPSSAGNYIVPANFEPLPGATVPSNAVYAPFEATYKFGKLLPNVGFTYRVSGPISIFGSYAKGFSAPRTDNLYRRPVVEITPEETNAFDLGARYTNNRVQAQATIWKIDYKNRIVSSFNPDLGISLDRNVGKVDSWGIDGSVAVRPIKQLSLLALASYIDTELKEDVVMGSQTFNPLLPNAGPAAGLIFCDAAPTAGNPIVQTCAPTAGKMVTETPHWQFGGRANVELEAFEFGVQAKWVGSRFATDVNDVKVKGYTTVDLDARVKLGALSERLDKTYLQFNVINLFKADYFGNISTQINAGGNPNFAVGSPRTFVGTLNVGF
jgi:iron complex outermembrane recepter protein